MNNKISKIDFLIIFFVSLSSISLELFFTRILTLKAWNHVVYTVIPFAILGYGIGANIHLIFNEFFSRFQKKTILSITMLAFVFFSIVSTFSIIHLEIRVDYLASLFKNWESIGMLSVAYTIFMVPFIIVGFIIVYLFSIDPKKVNKLYFIDLVGAGIGAALFFPLIHQFAVVRSIILLSFGCVLLSLIALESKKIFKVSLCLLLLFAFLFPGIPEPHEYNIDRSKGWEWIPGYFKKSDYELTVSRWHPLGRTDAYRMTNKEVRKRMYNEGTYTFLLNVHPTPEFTYLSTNYLAGTPAYHLSKEGLSEFNSEVKLFTIIMEAPYLFLDKPRVLVIGAGGGRDLFMAKTHDASSIVGAEINPGIVKEMGPGGKLHEYTGRIYSDDGVKVHLIDGRNLVKKTEKKSTDLIVLNGVDTLDALSSGAYAYAESYLYTKDAMIDYLEILDDDGMVAFYRWFFSSMPRESLRLHAIALEALKEMGVKRPWEHIYIGTGGWSMMLIKKTPFTADQIKELHAYSHSHNFLPIYPLEEEFQGNASALNMFDLYTRSFKENQHESFGSYYAYDISVMTDNRPFFYKYYKLKDFNPLKVSVWSHFGTIIFMSQLVVFLQALFFIILFIFAPLYLTKKNDISKMPKKSILPFVIFFSCLGGGFMLIEIPIMQRFVLLLGSPIYSITVILTALLISAGLGSFSLKKLKQLTASYTKLLTIVTFFISIYLVFMIQCGTRVYDHFLFYPFWAKVSLVALVIFPLGFSLGLYFPSGLEVISKKYKDTIAWAWAINGGFSVLGSILSIIIAQFFGFNDVLYLAAAVYFIGLLAFRKLEKTLN